MPLFAFEMDAVQPYLPYLVGCGVAVALSSAAWFFTRKPRGLDRPPLANSSKDWNQPADDTYANRRSSSRRDGTPVRVMLSSPIFRGDMETGWVLDRSTGGLRIAVLHPLAVGTSLQIRAENAPNTIPWVTVNVRSCRDEGQHHEVGCSFEQTPPWNVLLLFG